MSLASEFLLSYGNTNGIQLQIKNIPNNTTVNFTRPLTIYKHPNGESIFVFIYDSQFTIIIRQSGITHLLNNTPFVLSQIDTYPVYNSTSVLYSIVFPTSYTAPVFTGQQTIAEQQLRILTDATLLAAYQPIEAITTDTAGNFWFASARGSTTRILYTCPITFATAPVATYTLSTSTPITALSFRDGLLYFSQGNVLRLLTSINQSAIIAGTGIPSTRVTPYGPTLQDAKTAPLGSIKCMTYSSTERCHFFTDYTQNGIYKLTDEGFLASLCYGSTSITSIHVEGEYSGASYYIPSPYGITEGSDGSLYVSSMGANQVYRLRKTLDSAGNPLYMISILAGFSAEAGAITSGEVAKYARLNAPANLLFGSDGKLYLTTKRDTTSGIYGLSRLTFEETTRYYKGFTGAIRKPPIQVIGNNTSEVGIMNYSAVKNAVSTGFFANHMVADEQGNLYFADPNAGVVYKMDQNNRMTILVGIQSAPLYTIALWKNSFIYVATEDSASSALYSIPLANPNTEWTQFTGSFGSIRALTVHSSGALFIANAAGWIGYFLISSDTGRPTSTVASLLLTLPAGAMPSAMTFDSQTTLYIACADSTVRSYTVTPTGATTLTGFTGPSTTTVVLGPTAGSIPFGIAYAPSENALYMSSYSGTARVWRILLGTGSTLVATPYMGTTRTGYPTHGAMPSATTLVSPGGLCADKQGNVFVFDTQNRADSTKRSALLLKVPSKLFFQQETVYTLIGTGVPWTLQTAVPDSALANTSILTGVKGITSDFFGNIYFTDSRANIRKYDALTEQVTRIAGDPGGQIGFSGDGGPALNAYFGVLNGITVSRSGTVYVVDGIRIRKLTLMAGGSYIVNTFCSIPANPVDSYSGICIDLNETVYATTRNRILGYTLYGTKTIDIATSSILGDITIVGSTLYCMDVSRKVILRSIPPYTTTTDFLQLQGSPNGSLVADSQGNLFYTSSTAVYTNGIMSTSGEIRRIDASTRAESSYLGNSTLSDFVDSIIPVAGIRDGRHRSLTNLNSPGALCMDSFSRLLFADGGGTRIRCVPTGINQDPCGIRAAYIVVEPAVPGGTFQFKTFDIYSLPGAGTTTTGVSPFISAPMVSPSKTLTIRLGSTPVYITHIQIIAADPLSVGAKVYLFDSNSTILSVRILSGACTGTTGETLLYAVPWATTCNIPGFTSLNTVCGTPGIMLMTLERATPTPGEDLSSYFKSVIAVVKSGTTVSNVPFYSLTSMTFAAATEVLGVFLLLSTRAVADQTRLQNILLNLRTSTVSTDPPVASKGILFPNSNNRWFVFIDFRRVASEFGCASLDTLYQTGLGISRVRYVRVQRPSGATTLSVAEIVAISLESGENAALGRGAYTATGTTTSLLTTGVTTKAGGAAWFSPTDAWIEVDLGMSVPLEQVIVYPPAGTFVDYIVQAYTEQRDLVSIPSMDANPLSGKVARIRVHGSGYSETASLQCAALSVRTAGATADTALAASNSTFAASVGTSGSFYSATNTTPFVGGTKQHDYFELSFMSPQALDSITYKNPSTNWTNQYGAMLSLYNLAGRPLARMPLMGTNDNNQTFSEVIPVSIPKSVTVPISSNMRGVKGVRYVRYQNSLTSPSHIKISQLVVLDVNGVNRALGATVSYKSLGSWPDITTSGTAPIDGRIMPSPSLMYHSSGVGSDEYYMIDLGQEYEIDSVIYYSRSILGYSEAGCRIQLLGTDQTMLSGCERLLAGSLPREALDFRPEAENSYRIRYVRFEMPGCITTGVSLANLAVYDIYNRNIAQGRQVAAWDAATGQMDTSSAPFNPIRGSGTNYTLPGTPGSYWELDLGQEYSVVKLEFMPLATGTYTHTPVLFLDDERNTIKTFFLGPQKSLGTMYSIPLSTIPLNAEGPILQNTVIAYLPKLATGVPTRFIEVLGTATPMFLSQLVAVDVNGCNVALGKGIKVAGWSLGSDSAYTILNGQVNATPYSVTAPSPYMFIDLGGTYSLTSILLYGAQNVTSVKLLDANYGLQRQFQVTSGGSNPQILSVQSSGPQMLTPRIGLGTKARYVRLGKPPMAGQGFFLSQVVVTDAWGRNIALNKSVKVNTFSGANVLNNGRYQSASGNANFYHPNGNFNQGWTYTNELWIEFDLGLDYWITDITVYASQYIGWMSLCQNIDITLRDTYQTVVGTKKTTERISEYTFSIVTQLQALSTACPANTTEVSGLCLQNCNSDESQKDASTCYTSCAQGFILDSTNQTCAYCPANTVDIGTLCKPICENNPAIFSGSGATLNDTTCYKKLTTAPDGTPLVPVGTNGAYITDCWNGTGASYTIVNKASYATYASSSAPSSGTTPQNWADAKKDSNFPLGACGNTGGMQDTTFYRWWDSLSRLWFTNYRGDIGAYVFNDSFSNYGTSRMRKIQTIISDRLTITTQAKSTVPRPTRAKTVVPKGAAAATSQPGYDLITLSSTTRNCAKVYDWTGSSIDTNFIRDSSNPVYVKGRMLGETFNFTGAFTQSTYPLTIPAASSPQCPPGFVYSATALSQTGNPCMSVLPAGSAQIWGVYYGPCPNGYSVFGGTQCISDCPMGTSIKNTDPNNGEYQKCVTNCPTGTKPYEPDATLTQCATDCSLALDANGNPMGADTDPTKCATISKGTSGAIYTKGTWVSGCDTTLKNCQTTRAAWIRTNAPYWWTPSYSERVYFGRYVFTDLSFFNKDTPTFNWDAISKLWANTIPFDSQKAAVYTGIDSDFKSGEIRSILSMPRTITAQRTTIDRSVIQRPPLTVSYSAYQ